MSNVRFTTRWLTPFLVALLVTVGLSTMAQSSDYSDVVTADNPDGWWRMDDTEDETGNQISTPSGGVTFGHTPGAIAYDSSGHALFDGVDGVITVDDDPSLNYGATTDFSLVYWFKKDPGGSTTAVMAKGDSSAGYKSRVGNSGYVDILLDYGSQTDYANTPEIYADSKWHQAAIVVDRNETIKIYVDCELAVQKDIRSVSNTRDLRIGGGPDGYAPDGVDEFAVYDKALTGADALAHYTVGTTDPNPGAYAAVITADAPLGWWRMDAFDGSGNVPDASSNGHDGVPTAGVALVAPGPILGDPANYASLPGNDDIVVADFEELHFGNTQDFSYEAWFKTEAGSAFDVIMDKGNRYGNVFMRNNSAAGELRAQLDYNRTTVDCFSTTPINDGDWHHVVLTADRDDALRLYIDGVLEDTTSFDANRDITSALALEIGNGWSASYMDGPLDEVAVYSRLLSEAEICEQYLAGIPEPSSLLLLVAGTLALLAIGRKRE